MVKDIKLITNKDIGKEVIVEGWVKSNRVSSKTSFISLFDGSCFLGMQLVYKNQPLLEKLTSGSALKVKGVVKKSLGKQNLEIIVSKVIFTNKVDSNYPIQKKQTSLDFLRTIPHVRARTNTIKAITKIRSKLFFAIHNFYNKLNFYNIQTPIITSNDCEGASEAFTVTINKGEKDFGNDFFKTEALLTVSGQFHGEVAAQSFKKIYTFGPTFRSEQSHTSKHAAEFWMVEPEIAFCDLMQITQHAEKLVKYSISYVLKECQEEIAFLSQTYDKKLVKRLKLVVDSKFKYMEYKTIIEELKKAVAKGHKFNDSNIKIGMDLATEHERYICEQITKGPVFATHYPSAIKSFYMKSLGNGFVESFDLFVPGIGELIGGSVRENDYTKLANKVYEEKIDQESIQWYLDLRKFGSAQSAGFGLGFERLVMYVTGVNNIRDVIQFPRIASLLKF